MISNCAIIGTSPEAAGYAYIVLGGLVLLQWIVGWIFIFRHH